MLTLSDAQNWIKISGSRVQICSRVCALLAVNAFRAHPHIDFSREPCICRFKHPFDRTARRIRAAGKQRSADGDEKSAPRSIYALMSNGFNAVILLALIEKCLMASIKLASNVG